MRRFWFEVFRSFLNQKPSGVPELVGQFKRLSQAKRRILIEQEFSLESMIRATEVATQMYKPRHC